MTFIINIFVGYRGNELLPVKDSRLKARACGFPRAIWEFSPVYEMLEQRGCTIENTVFSPGGPD